MHSCEFCETFKNKFFVEHVRWSWSLSLKKSCLLIGVLKKVFEWLAANKEVYIGRNNNKVDSTETGRIVVADLLP